MANSTSVLIVEDHAVLSAALATALEIRGMEATVVAPDLEPDAILVLARRIDPTVALVDLYLGPERLGLSLIEPFEALGIATIVLTTSNDPVLLGECLIRGSRAVVDKASPFEALTDAISRAARGETAMPALERQALLQAREVEVEARAAAYARFDRLSPREREVLALLVEGATAKQVAHRLGVRLPTVRTQIRSVLQKLGAQSQRDAVVQAVRAGWRLDGR